MAEDLLTRLRAAIDATEAEALKHTDGGDEPEAFRAEKESNYPCNPYLRVNRDWALRWVAAAREVLERHVSEPWPPAGRPRDLDRPDHRVCTECCRDREFVEDWPCPDVRALAGVYGIGEG
jgi:hypothetical protein